MKISRCSSFFLLATLGLASTADARELTYTPADGCPPTDEVASRVDATAPEGRPATLVVTRARGGYHGVVTIGSGDRALERSVDAKSCGAVVDALALVIALDHEPAEEPPPAEPPPPAPPPDADRTPPGPPSHVDVSLGLVATATKVMRYETHLGPALYADVAAAGPTLDVAWLRPSARLVLARVYKASEQADLEGTFAARLTTVSLDGCPLGWSPRGTTFVASACARGQLGALEVETSDGTAGTTRLWSALGAIAKARMLVGSPGSLRWAFDIDAGVLAPLRRDRISVATRQADVPDYTFYMEPSVPGVTWTASIGAGLVLP